MHLSFDSIPIFLLIVQHLIDFVIGSVLFDVCPIVLDYH